MAAQGSLLLSSPPLPSWRCSPPTLLPPSLPPPGTAELSTAPVVPRFRPGAVPSAVPCGAARAAERRRLRGEPGGPEPAANGPSRALRLTQWEPAALPLSNERMGAGLGCASANERPGMGRSCT